jgi:hypothetical protein
MAKTKKKVKSQVVAQAQLRALMNKMRVGPKGPSQKGRKVPRAPGMGDAAARYAAALINPFSKEAEGVRVPEPYAISTVTRKVHVPMVLTASAGGALDFSVQPHLVNSFVQTLGSASGSAGVFTIANQPSGQVTRSAVTGSALASLVQSYRIVAIGVRIKTNVDFTRSGGRVYGALLPASQELPVIYNVGTTAAQALGCYEIPNDGANVTPSILNLPRGFQFTVSELMSEGGCEIHFPICSARALDFLDAQDQFNEQHYASTGAGGVQVGGAGVGQFCAAGHSQFVLRAEGLQASADVLTCEVIYHVEGIPLVGTATLVESTPHTPAPASPNEIHMAHRLAAVAPVVSYVSDKLRAAHAGANGAVAKRNFGGMARVAGAAERVLGIAVRGLGMV